MRGVLSHLPLVVGVVAALLLVVGALLVPVDVRHSAPAGFNLTLDQARGIAVTGHRVTPNYPNFDRLDLDLRAYTPESDFDLTIHIRPDVPGALDIRSIPLAIAGHDIRHNKPPLADPFTTVRFRPIADSAGQTYYVWVDRGPRNRDDVVTMWSFKSYSSLTGTAVVWAFLDDPPGTREPGVMRVALILLIVGFVGAFGWLMGALTAAAIRVSQSTNRRTMRSTVATPSG